ncbi:peroxisomal biogenesis factor 6 [Verticillium alfalfae VaMs.102]|uniref:Peroxisomal biogenesis factor 6 n=1 Tax=Verticillium alfalfae (strain VaMs.102 / ATCC MYA-4576 / FGSC 10136) TaxID=526221 RepID=C9SM29_VERA1|nr:peroxisomal biogenesis factor 6 [Verticillium alfalfae VaMs.102]EEY19844.1 peroxisomal biogenesis factor 6 [Verticillium alfalfae VaMs.102]
MASAILAKRRRRRRRADKPAAAATLLLDGNVKGDVGFLSDDLFADLFPQLSNSSSDDIQHVAIAPWAPTASPTKTSWTLVPVLKNPELGPSILQFSPRSLALQSFRTALQHLAPSKLMGNARGGIEILVLDAVALPLDTVFVNLEKESIKRLEQGEGHFFNSHPDHDTKGKAKAKTATSPEDHLTEALRVALGNVAVIHSGDQFLLPLPPHPVTHVPPNGGEIVILGARRPPWPRTVDSTACPRTTRTPPTTSSTRPPRSATRRMPTSQRWRRSQKQKSLRPRGSSRMTRVLTTPWTR